MQLKPPMHFVFIDGEGFGRTDDHEYRLLSAGDKSLRSKRPITWDQALSFMYAQYDERAVYGMYSDKYDLSQWFKDLRRDRAEMLISRHGIAKRARKNSRNPMPFPVEACPVHSGPCQCPKRWVFDLMQGERRFWFKPKRCTCPTIPTECEHVRALPPMWICDVSDYFQAPFLEVIESDYKAGGAICTAEELGLLRRGKNNRADAQLDDETVAYNLLENELAARMMERVRVVLARLDVFPRKNDWYGVGHVVQMWMDNQPGILTREASNIPTEILALGQQSYHSGWMEDIATGPIPGTVYAYDRHSAYCADMAGMPCLYHGRWQKQTGSLPAYQPGTLRYVHGTWTAPQDAPTGPFPYRESTGLIKRPLRVSGLYFQHEVAAAREAGLIETEEIDFWYEYIPCDCPPPFASIRTFYRLRQQYAKGTIGNRVLRIMPSVVYGKLCQSAGEPKYAHPLYASLITSLCRTEMLKAIASDPRKGSDLVRVAQDAVYFRHPRDLKLSDNLGDWAVTEHENLTLFYPGIYWDDKVRALIAEGQKPRYKARGFKSVHMSDAVGQADNVYRNWSRTTPWSNILPVLTFAALDIVTLTQAMRHDGSGNWSTVGQVKEIAHKIPSENIGKHRSVEMGGLYWDTENEFFRTTPYLEGESGLESAPFAKKFGWKEDDELEFGCNQDGSVLEQIRSEMRLK
jgi:hypothetical protein